jgi:hypothetical protein
MRRAHVAGAPSSGGLAARLYSALQPFAAAPGYLEKTGDWMNTSNDAQEPSSQPTAAESGNTARELAYKRTEDKLRAVANQLDRIATAYVNSLRSQVDRARRR